jgi:uncharacterized protein YerC
MSQVSKYPISNEIYERIINLLFKTVADMNTKKKVSDLFEEFLTPTEHIMLAKRLAIGLLLAKGFKYREIAGTLKVSITTIGSVAINLKYGRTFRNIVFQILEKEKMEDFWLSVAETISSVGLVGTKGTKSWRYLNTEIKKRRNSKPF